MDFILKYTEKAETHLCELRRDPANHRILKDVVKTLHLMQTNLRHPSLNTHEYHTLTGPNGEKVFEAYAQQKTAGAYRIFWYYGPGKGIISIIAITPHP
jgi:hypothetical protein